MEHATPIDVIEGRARWCVVERDALAVLADLPDGSIDAVITDPPYSSGGLYRSDRNRSTDTKYTQQKSRGQRPDFTGDNRDQRSFCYWCSLWMGEALRCSRSSPGGRLLVFTDWRQLPTVSDAVQAGGWIWRGLVPWNKGGGSRPVPGGFRVQCEYVLWCTTGALPESLPGVTVLPGFFEVGVCGEDKHHQTGKPTALMRELVVVADPGGIVLDPFGGSGTTGVAALLEGRRAIVCELVPEYAQIARERMAAAESGRDWKTPQQEVLFGGAPR